MNRDFEVLDKVIGKIPDFPKPGVLFYDITGILRHPEAFSYCIDRMEEIYKGKNELLSLSTHQEALLMLSLILL